jgi:hypothetical protein
MARDYLPARQERGEPNVINIGRHINTRCAVELAVEKNDKQYNQPDAGSNYSGYNKPVVAKLAAYSLSGLCEESLPLRVVPRNVVRVGNQLRFNLQLIYLKADFLRIPLTHAKVEPPFKNRESL